VDRLMGVSQELVREEFPDGQPLGRRLRINVDHANGKDDVEWTIVGVVGSVRSSLDGPVRKTIFVDPWTFGVTALVLVAAAAVAAYVPARRGMQLAPVDALRMN
jgi:hypothetical protein